MTIASPLQLEQYTLTSLVIKTRPQWNADSKDNTQADIKLTYNVHPHLSEPKLWVPCNVAVTWPDDDLNSPFTYLEVGLEGVFSFQPDAPTDITRRSMLCLTNLLGFARGVLVQATGNCRGGPYILTLINIEQLLKNSKA